MIIVVTGTGTGVGKTTLAVAIVRALATRFRVGAWKPVETGGDEDGRLLAAAAGREAGPSIVLGMPVAPSVAARREGLAIDLSVLAAEGRLRASDVDHLVVELPGGLYSPLNDLGQTNAELLGRLVPGRVILVASNRLGVLHDVEACRRAMRADGISADDLFLTGRAADASAPLNADELRRAGWKVSEVASPDLADAAARDWLPTLR